MEVRFRKQYQEIGTQHTQHAKHTTPISHDSNDTMCQSRLVLTVMSVEIKFKI